MGSLAGCIGSGGTGAPTDSPTDSPADSPTPTPGVAGTEFGVTDKGCGSGESAARVERDGDRVVVDGVVRGSNTCYTADLAGTTYEDGTLTVRVRSYEPTDAGVCGQCIVDIEYRATVTVGGPFPEKVVVVHDGERVASKTY